MVRGSFQSDREIELDLYAPLACNEAVRLIIAAAAALGYEIFQMDVKGAFFRDLLTNGEEIYVKLPKVPGLKSVSGKLMGLFTSICALRHAPRLGNEFSAEAVLVFDLQKTDYSFCLFFKKNQNGNQHIIVYVGDILVIGELDGIRNTKKSFKKLITVTGLGLCRCILGTKLYYSSGRRLLSQSGYTERVIEAGNMIICKPSRTRCLWRTLCMRREWLRPIRSSWRSKTNSSGIFCVSYCTWLIVLVWIWQLQFPFWRSSRMTLHPAIRRH